MQNLPRSEQDPQVWFVIIKMGVCIQNRYICTRSLWDCGQQRFYFRYLKFREKFQVVVLSPPNHLRAPIFPHKMGIIVVVTCKVVACINSVNKGPETMTGTQYNSKHVSHFHQSLAPSYGACSYSLLMNILVK